MYDSEIMYGYEVEEFSPKSGIVNHEALVRMTRQSMESRAEEHGIPLPISDKAVERSLEFLMHTQRIWIMGKLKKEENLV